MSRMIRSRFVALAALALVGSFVAPVSAEDKLPTGKEVLERYIEKTGGKEKYEAIETMLVKSKMEFVGQNIVADLSIRTAKPNLVSANFEIPGIGVIKRGTDGKYGWEESPMTGPRLLEGAELASMLEESDMTSVVNFDKQYSKIETVGTESINDKKAFKVELTSKSGRTETRFYDAETGYLVRTNAVQATQMGDLPTQVDMSDYKEVGGLVIPHTTSVIAGPQVMKVTLMSVETNVTHPEGAFAPGADIKELITAVEAEKSAADAASKNQSPATQPAGN